ncbi:DNA annealing helicase and endonuclease ZRANB3 isoform X2 [Vitis riparia]|uniref:DNA annealing helicase and endonuclease ZRANB3 isoform X2 n=1 Tax=Vitis riparia TaxID=96939 RepID=UPI00155AF00C|nr:DNA annealing helicase and endonuclease ZRANB3 isoform X2 [Vitis riparia]
MHDEFMEITEEQRKRAEANRLAALEKRKAALESAKQSDPWKLFKCRKVSRESTSAATAIHPPKPQNASNDAFLKPHLTEKFRVRLEICSPDSFSITPKAVHGFAYPGEAECLQRLNDCLANVVPSHYTQNHSGGKACVYKLGDYDAVLRCLKNSKGIEFEEIPWGTFNVVERLSHSFVLEQWMPCRLEHLSDDKVDELIGMLPKRLLDALLPFQLDGVRFGLRRGGRCLIADEMGLGKTLQAIAIASCFMNEGPILVVCPAILRFSWAEELEHWLPFCLPADIHLVFGHQNNPAHLTRCPRVVVISYTMLHRLRKSMLEREWALLIVDESHHLQCTKKKSEPQKIKAVLDVAMKVRRIVLLSGTPSLSRPYDIFHQINMLWPGLLGRDKYEFAKIYCAVNFVRGSQGKVFQDFSKGIRLEELNVLLKQTVMIRRLKEHVLGELPPKRRQIIRLLLKRADIDFAIAATRVTKCDASENNVAEEKPSDNKPDDSGGAHSSSKKLSNQQLGIAKLSGFLEWLSFHPIVADSDGVASLDMKPRCLKMIIFAHHLKVLDGIQEFICKKGIGFVRIDGNTLARDRQSAVLSFRSSTEAEDRAHRRGQTNAVNIYIFCAKDTMDESHWQNLNKSLHRVSYTTNGKYDAIQELVAEDISYLETSCKTDRSCEIRDVGYAAGCDISTKLIKLSNTGLAQDMQPREAYIKVSETINDRLEKHGETGGCSTRIDNLQTKADTVPDIEMQEVSVSSGELEGNAVTLGRVSFCKLSRESEDEDKMHKADNIFPETSLVDDGEPVQKIDMGESYPNQVDFLRFEVSQYTGRIHLYSCIPGIDSRPRPLFENFRPEELDPLQSTGVDNSKKTTLIPVKDNPAYRDVLLAFVKEWNNLRPIEQKKLLQKPLQLPLTVELCYLSEGINHSSGGLLKRGSKRRTTPLGDISYPLPSNAVWKKVYLCSGYGKRVKEYTQGWTLMDEPLCKLCQTPCKNSNAKTPDFFEDLFCSLGCYEEYRIRTSNRSLRQELFQIEHGICTSCQLDCHKLVQYIKPLSLTGRREYIEKVAPRLAVRKNLLDKLVNEPTEGNAWHADHIVPVYQGGGECRLENMRTLCVACHSDVTAAQCAERRSVRIKAKKQLKVIMNSLKDDAKMKHTCGNSKNQGHLEIHEDILEDELLIKVPGSAYSGQKSTTTVGELEELSPSKLNNSETHCEASTGSI